MRGRTELGLLPGRGKHQGQWRGKVKTSMLPGCMINAWGWITRHAQDDNINDNKGVRTVDRVLLDAYEFESSLDTDGCRGGVGSVLSGFGPAMVFGQ